MAALRFCLEKNERIAEGVSPRRNTSSNAAVFPASFGYSSENHLLWFQQNVEGNGPLTGMNPTWVLRGACLRSLDAKPMEQIGERT